MPASIRYIRSIAELDSVFSGSFDRPHIVLKHSISCGISAHILEQLTDSIDHEINVIVVQTERFLSDEVADRTGHLHQSPQIFVLANGKPVYHATHYGIDVDAVNLKLGPNEVAAPLAGRRRA